MSASKRILAIVSLIILITISTVSGANHRWNFLEGIDPNPAEFKELEIGDKIVYWQQRTIGEAIVELNHIVFQFDKKSRELIDVKVHWREDLPAFLPQLNITKEQAESMVGGRVKFSQLFIISPESDIFPIKPTPKNPCWVVASMVQDKGTLITVIDAVEAKILGYGVPPPQPYTAFSLSGPQEQKPCKWAWDDHYLNAPYGAKYWFDTMGYSTEANEWPTEEKVKSHIQSGTTAMFYELAHGAYWGFASGCDANCYEMTWASEIDDWISDYTKMPFTFLGSCDGMCDTNIGTLSYAFRMGSTRDTATVGYCEMDRPDCYNNCWPYALRWQKALFENMNDGHTVKEAFDMANWDYPDCNEYECMRFVGDPNFAVVPIVPRVPPFPSLTIVDDVNDTDCVYPYLLDQNYLNYEICYDANGNSANDVIIVSKLPFEVDYNSSDCNGVYDSNFYTVTWDIGDISGADSNCVHLTVKVNQFAKPGSAFRNYCEIRNDEYSRNATEKTNICCWGPDIIYVDANAGGFNNGTSWQDAYTDLQDGLTGASNCDGKNLIKVAAGTYNPTKHIWYPHGSFQLVNGVDIYGGYPSGGGQRNPDAYQTILSGDIDGNSTPDIYYVVSGADNVILDGFTVTKGGTGIYCKDSNNLTIADCMIIDNISDANGGGIYCEDSNNVTITNCTITDNEAGNYGGGIYDSNSSSSAITNCTFSGNSAKHGGGLFNNYSSPNITNCIFTGNKGATSDGYGGGMYGGYSSPTVVNCIFSGNNAKYGGGMGNAYESSPAITNCTFSGNKAGTYGGGMYNYGASLEPDITNCIFWDNDAVTGGNEIYNDGTVPNISYCDIEGGLNNSPGCGGDDSNDGGGNIDNDPCFIEPNTPTGSWTENASYDSSTFQSTLTDGDANWLINELAGKFIDPNTSQHLQFLIVSNDVNTIKVWSDVTSIAGINDTYEILDYHLSADSNCIDAGDPNFDPDPNQTDIDGEDRVVNGRVDIGADEYYWSPADFNRDKIVNFLDYAELASAWQSTFGEPNYDEKYDLVDNNSIDYADLARFVEDWLWQAGWTKTFAAGCGQSMSQSFGLMEGLYLSAPAKQQPTQIKPLDIEEILKWLDEIWLDEEVRKVIDEDEWLKFMESIKEQI